MKDLNIEDHAWGSTVITASSSTGLILLVRDTGTGIIRDDFKNLFIPFVRVDSGTTRRHEGSGPGLSVTKNPVELHNQISAYL